MFIRSALSAILAGFVVAGVAQETEPFGESVQRGRILSTHDMAEPRPEPPRDIYRPSGNRGAAHFDLANFAWLEFIALSAPADPERRGSPGGSFADSGVDPDATLVWETYQHRSELFPFVANANGPVPPQPWDAPPKYVFDVDGQEYEPEFDNFNNLDEASQIGQALVFFPGLNGDPDKQVLFQAKVNRAESDYVKRLADGSLSATSTIDLPDNSIEVKSAWVPLEAIPVGERYRFHTSEVIYYTGEDDAPEAKTGLFALLGLHIIQKTRNYPTWIYATFEQADILTRPTIKQDRGVYYVPTYDDIGYTLPATTTFGDGTVVNNPETGFNINWPAAVPNGRPVPLPFEGPVINVDGAVEVDGVVHVPIVQPPTANFAVTAANWWAIRAMSRLPGFDRNFVWQYYRLKGVQAIATNNPARNDFYLANIAIESVQPGLQLWRGGQETVTDSTTGTITATNIRNQVNVQDPKQEDKVFSAGGCMGCHGVAATKFGFDHSYLFFGRDGKGYSPQTSGLKDQETMLGRIPDLRP